MLKWYHWAVNEIRQAVDIRRLTYDQGMRALAELARLLGEDAGVATLWAD